MMTVWRYISLQLQGYAELGKDWWNDPVIKILSAQYLPVNCFYGSGDHTGPV
jgi:hypothetical protein